ncbi:MAG: NAD-dependent epimerase/dehydratase family protein, partial [Acidobacteriota bacterium]
MRAFLTGATGFVGANLARALLADGHAVRALVRPSSDLSNLAELPLELASGDLDSPEVLCDLVGDCDVIFHAAALYSL